MLAQGDSLFTYDKNKYVILADSHSGYGLCQILKNESNEEVWKYLLNWFKIFGYPKVLKTDDRHAIEGNLLIFVRNIELSMKYLQHIIWPVMKYQN